MRSPEEAANLDASTRELGEYHRERWASVGEFLVVVASPIGQAEKVAGFERLQLGGEPGEIRVAVHERLHVIAVGPRVFTDERPALEPALALVEEPWVTPTPSLAGRRRLIRLLDHVFGVTATRRSLRPRRWQIRIRWSARTRVVRNASPHGRSGQPELAESRVSGPVGSGTSGT